MKTIYTAREIKRLNDYFKKNSCILNEEEFTIPVVKLLKKCPAMYKGFISSYHNGKNLQPGYLTEINICATLAKKWVLPILKILKKQIFGIYILTRMAVLF